MPIKGKRDALRHLNSPTKFSAKLTKTTPSKKSTKRDVRPTPLNLHSLRNTPVHHGTSSPNSSDVSRTLTNLERAISLLSTNLVAYHEQANHCIRTLTTEVLALRNELGQFIRTLSTIIQGLSVHIHTLTEGQQATHLTVADILNAVLPPPPSPTAATEILWWLDGQIAEYLANQAALANPPLPSPAFYHFDSEDEGYEDEIETREESVCSGRGILGAKVDEEMGF